jgi:ABC-2 type transport system permease protein
MRAIVRKELADYFTSMRFPILLALVILVSGLALYSAHQGIRGGGTPGFVFLRLFTTEPRGIPFAFLFNFVNFIALFFIPIIGIILGFDAINRERSAGTLSRIISQPIFRDSVINGKFLAALITLALMMTAAMLLVSGYGLSMIGVPPSAEEIIRLFLGLIFIIIYGAFWIGLAMLFSILFRSLATSLLSAIAVWIFFSFGIFIIALGVAKESPELFLTVLRFSPNWMFGQATSALLYPITRTLGTISPAQMAFMIPNPLSLGQSVMLVWPYFTGLISLSAICFAVSYVLFMKQEIRST